MSDDRSSPAAADAAVDKATDAAHKAAADARAAAAHAAHVKAEAAREVRERADRIEADTPHWDVVHRAEAGMTERMVIPGGSLLRSTWKHHASVVGGEPLAGSAMVFIPGAAPDLVEKGAPIVLRAQDLPRGVDADTVTYDDLRDVTPPILGLADASEVLLRMYDNSVRVLKEAPPAKVKAADKGPDPQKVAAEALARQNATAKGKA